MNTSLIIQELRTHAALFAGRVAGAAEFAAALENSAGYTAPSAWVIPLGDDPEQISSSSTMMDLTERFGVCVMLDAAADARGQAAMNDVDPARNTIWSAILGWQVDESCTPIEYNGGEPVKLDRAHLFYRFDFSFKTEIGPEFSREYADLQALQDLQSVSVQIDMVDPAADRNTPPVTDPELGGYAGGSPGPDGRIEHQIDITLPTS